MTVTEKRIGGARVLSQHFATPPADAAVFAARVRSAVGAVPAERLDVGRVLMRMNARVEVRDASARDLGGGAVLRPCDDGFVVELARSTFRDEGTRRFALAHELGHMFFYDRTARLPQRWRAPCRAEERFCDGFARTLLAPRAPLRGLIQQPSKLVEASEHYGLPLRRLAAEAALAWDLRLTTLRPVDDQYVVEGSQRFPTYRFGQVLCAAEIETSISLRWKHLQLIWN